MFSLRQLRGHKKSVLCLDSHGTSADRRLLVSGSEDSTARIWDLRTDRAQKCFMGCFGEAPVDSVAFLPTDASQTPIELVLASGSSVFLMDIRKDGIIDRVPRSVVRMSALGDENEVNSISVHPDGHLLAAAMDDGSIKRVSLSEMRRRSASSASAEGEIGTTTLIPEPTADIVRSFPGGHSNVASAVCFRPTSQAAPAATVSDSHNSDLFSGGFDCCVQLWDASTGLVKGSKIFGAGASGGQVAGTMVNPPFVHSCAYVGSGKAVLCGTGDGALQILHPSSLVILDSEEAHSGFVSCIHVPPRTRGGPTDTYASNDDNGSATIAEVVFSGGNDSTVHAWKVTYSSTKSKPKSKSKSKKGGGATGAGAGALVETAKLQSLWTLAHGRKINAISTIAGSQVRGANAGSGLTTVDANEFALAVGDVTANISVYTYQ